MSRRRQPTPTEGEGAAASLKPKPGKDPARRRARGAGAAGEGASGDAVEPTMQAVAPPIPATMGPGARRPDDPGPGSAGTGRLAGTLARTTTIVTAALLSSRLLGFLRDTSLSDRFGASHLADAYVVASTIPLLIFGVVGQALPTIFIPQYTRVLQTEGRARAEALANNITMTLTGVALVLMAIMWAVAPLIVDVVAPGIRAQDPAEAALAGSMVRIMIPIILFYLWSAVMQGILNTHGHFLAPAAMGVPQNLIIIAAIFAGSSGLIPGGIAVVAWGSMIGTAFTFLVQLLPLRRIGFHFRLHFSWHDPLLRQTIVLAGPVVVASVFSQLGVTIDRVLASGLPAGAISAIYYATRLQQFTYVGIGLAISTVLFPQLARHATSGSLEQYKSTVNRGLRLISLISLPITVGIFAFRYGILRVVFQHGVFTADATGRTALALLGFAPGVLTYAFMDYLMRTFFARQDTRVPMYASIVSVLVNIAGDFLLVGPWRQAGLTLASSLAWGIASVLLLYRMRRDLGPLGGRRTATVLLRMLAASVIGVAPAYALYDFWITRVAGQRFLHDALGLAVAGLIAVALYLLALGWLRVPEVNDARRLLAGGLRRLGLGGAGG